MADLLCAIMGIADMLAGGLIIFSFFGNFLGMLFGIIMITKGGISFI
jgi:hypothetical protein